MRLLRRTQRRAGNCNALRSAEGFRQICSCQKHRRAGRIVRAFRFARLPYLTLLLGVPLAFGALPQRPQAKPPVEQARAAAMKDFVTLPPLDENLNLLDDVEFRLITPKVRNEFLAEKIVKDTFTMEVVKAEFFRTEVPYGAIIYREAKRHGIAPELVAAIVETESDFRPRLTSHKHAVGLMQLIPSTGALMGVTNLTDPSENVRAGVKYIRYLQDRFGSDQRIILAAYNAGESAVRRYGGIPPYTETQNYLVRVAKSKQKYQRKIEGRVDELSELLNAE